MEIGDWSATPDLNEIYREIRTLGLETNLAELEAFGFTIVEGALDAAQVTAMRGRILALAQERLGRSLDLEGETEPTAEGGSDVSLIPYLLYKDPVFKQAVVNPGPLALITYLLGRHCILSSLTCHLKGPGGRGLALHSDTANGVPDPFPAYSMVANCNYALTDYTEAGGCLAMVPGSHRHHRQTTAPETVIAPERRYRHVVPIEVPAGSAIVWQGTTWHGSYPRTIPGLRLNLSVYYCREFMAPQEDYRRTVPAGFVDPDTEGRLATLLGADLAYGWTDEGPTRFYRRQAERTVRSWHS